jgi:hypothetical protein
MKRILFGLASCLLLAFSLTAPAFAEEPAPAYTPPPEAHEGVGGWAVVDPNTGIVHGVVVCTVDVCGPSGSWGGKMPIEYQGCTGCDLRFQTRATDDGNVAGYSGHSYQINSDGSVDVKNDGSVTWNAKENNFSIKNQSVDSNGNKIERKQKLIPEKTATDGKNLHTGIVDIETNYQSSDVSGESVEVNVKQKDFYAPSEEVKIAYRNWRVFEYESALAARESLENDVNSALVDDGYEATVEEDSEEDESKDEIVSDQPEFVQAVKQLTTRVIEFLSGWFR